MDSAGRNDTLPGPGRAVAGYEVQAAAGEVRKQTDPRAAGAASPRGAQPSGQRITICQRCRKRLMQVRNGEWYHERNSSAFCDHTDGTHRKAIPLEVEVA